MIDKNAIVKKLTDVLEPLPFVHAFWLEGADATGVADEFSDIDFWADVEDAHEEAAIEAVENALSELAEIDYKYIMRHGHPKIRQRVYHLAGTSEYLLLDFCWQLHSRPREECVFCEDDTIETVKIIFDKSGVVQFSPPGEDAGKFAEENTARLEEAKYRRSQYVRAEKYVRRGLYLEAHAYYFRYVFEPLVDLLRLIHTPAHSEYYLVHISRHIAQTDAARLEFFAQISSLDDIRRKIPLAGEWFDELLKKLEAI
ncbi:MAG: hypothetical protein FWF77_05470 [Defluviitaleaceae bacterium]|nr:hypothetical protein [Defluviitaleaceae bacterium]